MDIMHFTHDEIDCKHISDVQLCSCKGGRVRY